jgi:hypothetical protein
LNKAIDIQKEITADKAESPVLGRLMYTMGSAKLAKGEAKEALEIFK